MRALIQRVTQASVLVANEPIGSIEQGILAYIGIGHDDTLQEAQKLIDKILTYRIFDNEGKLDKNVQQVSGGLLLVSQFTLMAKTDKGRRPDFGNAMPSNEASILFDALVTYAKEQYQYTASGLFGAHMIVTSHNDGPLNFILDV